MRKTKRSKSAAHRAPSRIRVWRTVPPPPTSDFDRFMKKHPKLLKREMFILALTEKILGEMIRQKMKRSKLASRMGRSPAWVERFLLGDDRYLKVRNISDACHALGVKPVLIFKRKSP